MAGAARGIQVRKGRLAAPCRASRPAGGVRGRYCPHWPRTHCQTSRDSREIPSVSSGRVISAKTWLPLQVRSPWAHLGW